MPCLHTSLQDSQSPGLNPSSPVLATCMSSPVLICRISFIQRHNFKDLEILFFTKHHGILTCYLLSFCECISHPGWCPSVSNSSSNAAVESASLMSWSVAHSSHSLGFSQLRSTEYLNCLKYGSYNLETYLLFLSSYPPLPLNWHSPKKDHPSGFPHFYQWRNHFTNQKLDFSLLSSQSNHQQLSVFCRTVCSVLSCPVPISGSYFIAKLV